MLTRLGLKSLRDECNVLTVIRARVGRNVLRSRVLQLPLTGETLEKDFALKSY
jgi:hypothetical protein